MIIKADAFVLKMVGGRGEYGKKSFNKRDFMIRVISFSFHSGLVYWMKKKKVCNVQRENITAHISVYRIDTQSLFFIKKKNLSYSADPFEMILKIQSHLNFVECACVCVR